MKALVFVARISSSSPLCQLKSLLVGLQHASRFSWILHGFSTFSTIRLNIVESVHRLELAACIFMSNSRDSVKVWPFKVGLCWPLELRIGLLFSARPVSHLSPARSCFSQISAEFVKSSKSTSYLSIIWVGCCLCL